MIPVPIVYCSEDQAVVAAFAAMSPEAQSSSFWSDPVLENLRSRVKAFYIEAQKTRCCYCDRHLGSEHHRVWDVEHVVARVQHPHFMFEPRNLAASCPECNICKGDENVLVRRRRKTYPNKSTDFLIIHPHFDKFDDHIFRRGMVYVGKTEKGKRTIYVCDLLRFAQMFVNWENSASDSSFEQEVDSVFDMDAKVSEAAVEAIVARLTEK